MSGGQVRFSKGTGPPARQRHWPLWLFYAATLENSGVMFNSCID